MSEVLNPRPGSNPQTIPSTLPKAGTSTAKMLRISVVIPTYRRPALLIKCLRKLELQTLPTDEFEVLVVTDGPDDVTFTDVEQFSKTSLLKVKCFSTPQKKGPAAARNYGWQKAKAKIIAFTDDDCLPESGWLQGFLIKKLIAGDAFALSGFTFVPIDDEPTDFALNTRGLQHAAFITANCACSRFALELTGGFDERYGTAWREDSDLEFNLVKKNIPIYKVNGAVVTHPVREAPFGVSIKEQKKGLYDALLFKKHPRLYSERLSPKIIYDFYFIVITDLICLIALINGWWYIAAATFVTVAIMIGTFFFRRIKNTRKTTWHIWEMLVTSAVIPFLSVYWRLYGAVKFRVLFL